MRRRPILIAADLGRALLVASIPLAAVFGRLTLVQLYGVAALAGVLTVFFDVAYEAFFFVAAIVRAVIARDMLTAGQRQRIAEHRKRLDPRP